MSKNRMVVRVAEVSYIGRIDEYEVVAEDNVQARGLIVMHLNEKPQLWTSIRVRDTPTTDPGLARVIGKI